MTDLDDWQDGKFEMGEGVVSSVNDVSRVACCRMCDGADKEGSCVLYARLATLELPPQADLTDYWAEPVSYFLVKGNRS
jgi:hypothetical protein